MLSYFCRKNPLWKYFESPRGKNRCPGCSVHWLATFTLWHHCVPFAERLKFRSWLGLQRTLGLHTLSRGCSPPSCARRPLLKAFECNGQLTTVFAIHRAGLIAYRARSRRPRNNSYAFERPAASDQPSQLFVFFRGWWPEELRGSRNPPRSLRAEDFASGLLLTSEGYSARLTPCLTIFFSILRNKHYLLGL